MKELIKMSAAIFLLLLAFSCRNEIIEPGDDENSSVNEDCACSANDNAAVLKVGAGRQYKTLKEAAAAAKNNTVIEIDAGTYRGDAAVALWTQDSLVIRASDGEVTLDADGKSMEDKAIWVIDGGTVCVEEITFINAKVSDQNGAGIRLTDGQLTVIDCRFLHNEMGLLT
ncbi:MAG: hypothetical protein LBC47_01790, partial [Tannerella sp.]|nr:hypothetical protein [Tannerella sp.]